MDSFNYTERRRGYPAIHLTNTSYTHAHDKHIDDILNIFGALLDWQRLAKNIAFLKPALFPYCSLTFIMDPENNKG